MDMIDDRANPTYFCIPWDALMHETASLVLFNYTTSFCADEGKSQSTMQYVEVHPGIIY